MASSGTFHEYLSVLLVILKIYPWIDISHSKFITNFTIVPLFPVLSVFINTSGYMD